MPVLEKTVATNGTPGKSDHDTGKLPVTTSKESSRSKSTIDLKTAFSSGPKHQEKAPEKQAEIPTDIPVAADKLKQAWFEFAELRKHQIAEYTLLKKDFTFTGINVTIMLANQFEEPLLENIRTQLIAHLRGRLNNNSINVSWIMQENESVKIAWSPREKFTVMMEKNPALKELKERFGLDVD